MTKVQKKVIWKKGNILVGKLTFKKNNKIKAKEYVELNRKIVLIVPVDGKCVYLLREYGPLIGKTIWRVPAGNLKQNENPLKGAARELLEEAGLLANKITLLNNYDYMGWVKLPICLFKAEGLSKKQQRLEFYEKINLVKVTKKEAKRIALDEMVELHHSFAVLKCLE